MMLMQGQDNKWERSENPETDTACKDEGDMAVEWERVVLPSMVMGQIGQSVT